MFLFQESGLYVGFANLPNQVHRKSVKKGFEFTLMVVGKHSLETSLCEGKPGIKICLIWRGNKLSAMLILYQTKKKKRNMLLALSYHLVAHKYEFVETSQHKRQDLLFKGL